MNAARRGDYSLLSQKVKFPDIPPGMVIVDPRAVPLREVTVAEHIRLEDKETPEAELADYLAARATYEHTVSPVVSQLNPVCVWDLDVIRSTTETSLRSRAELDAVGETALRLLDSELGITALRKAGRDLAVGLALGLTLGPTVLLPLALVDACYELMTYRQGTMLADVETVELANSAVAAKRIMTRNPSLLPVLLALMSVVGDVAAIGQFEEVVHKLGRAQLLLVAWSLADAGVGDLLGELVTIAVHTPSAT